MQRARDLTPRRACPLAAGALALTLALALALAGCGAGHSVTKQDVIARGNAICSTAASAVRSLPPSGSQSSTALAHYYRLVTPIVQTEIRQLQALPRPARDRALLSRYLGAIASSAAQYRALAAAAQRGDRGALASASVALRSNPAASLAARYGIAECAASPGTAAS